MLKFLTILVLAIVAAKAFEDSEYNNRDKRDAEDMPAGGENKEIGVHRGDGRERLVCCTGDNFNTKYFKLVKAVKKQCAQKLRANNTDVENFDAFDSEKMARIKQLIICEGECFGKKLSMLDESGVMNRELILELYRVHLTNASEWKRDRYTGYVEKCLDKVNAIERPANQQCDSAPMEFHHCMWGEFMNGCPDDLRINTPKCNRMRVRHSKGPGPFMSRNLLHEFLHGRYPMGNDAGDGEE